MTETSISEEMELAGFSEISTMIYKPTCCHIPGGIIYQIFPFQIRKTNLYIESGKGDP
jgi:hypothetical protein